MEGKGRAVGVAESGLENLARWYVDGRDFHPARGADGRWGPLLFLCVLGHFVSVLILSQELSCFCQLESGMKLGGL